MIRKSLLILATTFAAGLLFVNIYNSLVDAVSWGSNIPASIQTTKDYYKVVNPGNFFRIFSPINQVLALLVLIVCWKTNKRIRIYCVAALLIAVVSDLFTFAYFYPRNEIMFGSTVDTNLEALKTAWTEWTTMNWFRSGLVLLNLIFDWSQYVSSSYAL
ncbi:MAG: DUF1772 domain-containing protein [Ginsengibacter sp.]